MLAYVSSEGSQPGTYISTPRSARRREEARHGYMFSTAKAIPVSSSSEAMPSTKPAAYSRCHRNGGCTTTTSAPTASAISADRCSLPQGSVPQTRWVNSRHGEWIATIGRAWCSESCLTAETCWLSASMPTITSMASYPSLAAYAKACAVDSG